MKYYILILLFIVISPTVQAQNVGIGTTNPMAKLHVAGEALIDSNFTALGHAVIGGELLVLGEPTFSETQILDLNQTVGNLTIDSQSKWQSFTPQIDGILSEIEFYFD